MKKLIICLFTIFSASLFAEAGPVTIGVCPTCPTAKKPVSAPKKSKPAQPKKPKSCPPAKKEPCPTCEQCPKCVPEVRTVEVEKTVYAPAKKNTFSLVVGQDYNGLKWDRKGKDVNFKRNYGWVGGIRYERKLDETWSVSGEYLSNESGNLGVGFSW